MIRVVRAAPPAHLASPHASLWANALCERRAAYYRQLSAAKRDPQTPHPKRPHANSDHYGHSTVRLALKTMFGGKCAYCEGDTAAISPQHVEHYRPASHYPALAYQWANLLLACPHCNSTYKKDRFPIEPAGNTPRENRRTPCAQTGDGETPWIINPCLDDPTAHLTFRRGYAVALANRGKYTRRICGLNREDLVRSRRAHLKIVRFVIEKYRLAAAEENQFDQDRTAAFLREMSRETAKYAGMVRAELAQQKIDWATI